ncbi:MAG: hypothetical protein O3B01_00805 [Planctomycetota bacterium]|nr:hypothetical protein [Planctomycetota bacterium]MDA1137093.1 hypothetical protein [Planctomycetota bacterium]
MDEPPIQESRIGFEYYNTIIDTGSRMGRPDFFNALGQVLACPGRSSDHVYMFMHIEDSVIKEAKWQCHMCDPWMQIAADIACSLVKGLKTSEILDLKLPQYEEKLGGKDFVVASHTGAATLVAYKACMDYEVKETIKSDQEDKVSPKSALSDLGYTGRDGMLRLKRLIESRFDNEQLKIPRARLESICASGTVQDCSSMVVDMIERRAIELVKANDLGFPRSFDEALDSEA